MKPKKWLIFGFIAILVLALVGIVHAWFQRPLLGQSISEIAAQITSAPAVVETKVGMPAEKLVQPTAGIDPLAVEPLVTLIPTVVSTGEPVCKAPPTMLVLALGVDANDQADAIRLIRLDFVSRRITVLAVPRDLWVTVPDLAEHGITEGRINATLGYGDYFWGAGKGIVLVERTFDENFQIQFDHYGTLNYRAFIKAVDTLGGVDIYLDEPLNGGTQGLPYFGAGQHHLTGESALSFIRIRFPDTDVHRTRRQTQVAKLLFKKALLPQNWVKLPGLLADLQKEAAATDLSPADINMILCLAQKLEESDIVFYEIPQDLQKPYMTFEGGSVRLPLPGLYSYIQYFINGTLPLP